MTRALRRYTHEKEYYICNRRKLNISHDEQQIAIYLLISSLLLLFSPTSATHAFLVFS